mmetsp:Transcript_10301/g.30171  ORF Transcript_10301/g.30171 Transcript_10301/m.30171 type:complete len:88 (-) Transcript_10301:107-370(-)
MPSPLLWSPPRWVDGNGGRITCRLRFGCAFAVAVADDAPRDRSGKPLENPPGDASLDMDVDARIPKGDDQGSDSETDCSRSRGCEGE